MNELKDACKEFLAINRCLEQCLSKEATAAVEFGKRYPLLVSSPLELSPFTLVCGQLQRVYKGMALVVYVDHEVAISVRRLYKLTHAHAPCEVATNSVVIANEMKKQGIDVTCL